jgi:RNA-directed DNA polymerase
MLWRWALRRYRCRSKKWIKAKYFGPLGDRNWVFQGGDTDAGRATQPVRLFYIECVPIKGHVKVRGEANPYDPEWETYFERRLDAKMQDDLKGWW